MMLMASVFNVCFNPFLFLPYVTERRWWVSKLRNLFQKTKSITFKILSDLLILFSEVHLLVSQDFLEMIIGF